MYSKKNRPFCYIENVFKTTFLACSLTCVHMECEHCHCSSLYWFFDLTNFPFVPFSAEFAFSEPATAAQQPLLGVARRRPHHLQRAADRRWLLHLPGTDRRRQHPRQGSTGGHRWWGNTDTALFSSQNTHSSAANVLAAAEYKLFFNPSTHHTMTVN